MLSGSYQCFGGTYFHNSHDGITSAQKKEAVSSYQIRRYLNSGDYECIELAQVMVSYVKVMLFSSSFCYLLSLISNYFPCHLLSNTPKPCPSLRMKDQVSDSLKFYRYFIFFLNALRKGSLDILVLVWHILSPKNSVTKM
jgi:hypothetical protein